MGAMPLWRCERCRYLFEASKRVCPACGRPAGAGAVDPDIEEKKTIKRPPVKPKG